MNVSKLSAALSLIITIAGSVWWASNNIVFAEDFNQYQKQEHIRWLIYDSDQLWRQYRELNGMPDSPLVRQRRAELERLMQRNKDEIKAARGK